MSAFERHYDPKQLSELWGWSVSTVRRIFKDEPGVLLIGKPSRRLKNMLKRSFFTMQIPESVAIRVYERMRNR